MLEPYSCRHASVWGADYTGTLAEIAQKVGLVAADDASVAVSRHA